VIGSRRFQMLVVWVMACLLVAAPSTAGAEEATELFDHPTVEVLRADTGFPPQVWVEVIVHGAGVLSAEDFDIVGAEAGLIPQVRPVSTEGVQVVLAIDTSGSMRGAAIDEAKSAAAAFLDSMPAGVEVGVVSAGAGAQVIVPITADHAAVRAGIEGLVAEGETAVYDAIAASIDLLAQRQQSSDRIVVVMTDGADTVSTNSLGAVLERITESGITLHGVSLETAESQLAALDQLAGAAVSGLVLPAIDPAALSEAFGQLTSAVTSRYEITFVVAESATEVSIGVVGSPAAPIVVTDATWGQEFAQSGGAAPEITVPIGVAPVDSPRILVSAPEASIVEPPSGLFADVPQRLGVICIAIAFLLVGMVLMWPVPEPTRMERRRKDLAHRHRPGPKNSVKGTRFGVLAEMLERVGRRGGKRSTVDVLLEQAGAPWRPGEYMVIVGGVSCAAGFSGIVLNGPVLGLVFVALGPLMGRLYLARRASQRRRLFAEQLGPALQLLAGNLRVGHGMLAAVDSVARESIAPSAEEFQRVVAEVRLGRSLSDSLHAMSDRLESEDLDWVAQAVEIQREVGGDLAEVLDNVAETLSERARLARHVESLAADGKMSSLVMIALPFVVGGLISLKTPAYLAPLVLRSGGRVLLGIAIMLLVGGAAWLIKLTKVVF
jgi:tight adherence protein B